MEEKKKRKRRTPKKMKKWYLTRSKLPVGGPLLDDLRALHQVFQRVRALRQPCPCGGPGLCQLKLVRNLCPRW